jgi:hypothetical protein
MSEQIPKRPAGRPMPAQAAAPVVEDRIEMPPTADHVEGAPMPLIDTKRSEEVAAPVRAGHPEDKKHTWHKVYIDLGASADKITINEQEFHQGQTAVVRDDLLPVLNEVMYNTKMHERVVRGEASPYGNLQRLQGRR